MDLFRTPRRPKTITRKTSYLPTSPMTRAVFVTHAQNEEVFQALNDATVIQFMITTLKHIHQPSNICSDIKL